DIIDFLLRKFSLQASDVYQVNGPVNLHRLIAIRDVVDKPALCYPPFTPAVPARIGKTADMFEAIRKDEILLHHPFQSFDVIVELIRQAAADPDVLVIKQTLYRTGDDSSV